MTQTPSVPSGGSKRGVRVLQVAGALLLLSIGGVVLARSKGASDWPATMPAELAHPSPPFPEDSAAWPALQQALDAMPATRDADLGRIRTSQDPAAIEAALTPYEAALTSFAIALQHPNLRIPSEPPITLNDGGTGGRRHHRRREEEDHIASSEQPSRPRGPGMFRFVRLASVGALRARLQGLRGNLEEEARSLAQIERYSNHVVYAQGALISSMIGFAAEGRAQEAMQRLATLPEGLDAALARPMEEALDEAIGFPSPLPGALGRECTVIEPLYRSMAGRSSSELLATSSLDGRNEAGGFSPLPASWLFDAERTIAAQREFCHQLVEGVSLPIGQRRVPEAKERLHPGSFSPSEWFDNRLGRVLLSISAISYRRYVEAEEQAVALRQASRVALAIARYRRERRSNPAELGALVPAYLRSAPPAQIGVHRLQWNAATHTLEVTRLQNAMEGRGRWVFSEQVLIPPVIPTEAATMAPTPAP